MAKRNTYFQDEIPERRIDLKQLVKTLRYILPYKKVFLLMLSLMLFSSLVAMVPPLVLKRITDVVIPNKDHAQLVYMVLSMVALAAIEITISFVHTRIMGKTGHTVISNIRKEIFYKLQELPFEYFDNRPNGKISERGNFEELMALNGDFAHVYNIQQAQRQSVMDYDSLATKSGVN